MNNLVLIGMPACGKSTVGVVLAKTVGMAFIDTDLLIQEREMALLQEIIDAKGNEYFQEVERKLLSNLTCDKAIISTGGSAVYYEDAMKNLSNQGKIIYLKLPIEEIERRLNNIKTRGITMGKGETLKDLYEKRTPIYEKYANVIVETLGLSVEETIEVILRKI